MTPHCSVAGGVKSCAVAVAVAIGLTGCSPKKSAPATSTTDVVSGEAVYTQYCAMCHMADGSGVPDFQPALAGSPIVAGDRAKLESVIRAGSAALKDRENELGWEMPPFGFLTDEEVAAVIEYVRQSFGKSKAADSAP